MRYFWAGLLAVDIGSTKFYITKDTLPIRFVAAHGTFNPIIQGTECLSCCILAGMRRGLDKFAVIRPDPLFNMEPGLISQLEDSSLRRLCQYASEDVFEDAFEDALPLPTQSSEIGEIEETGKDIDDGNQSAAGSYDGGGSVNQDNSIIQGQESCLGGESDDDEGSEEY